MKVKFIVTGKTVEKYLKSGIQDYEKRIKHLSTFEYVEIPDVKNTKAMSESALKKAEAVIQLKHLQNNDCLILLDERGKQYKSVAFAGYIQKLQMRNYRNIVFLVGGPYGFDEDIYTRATDQLSLSAMTFPHQLIRLIFIEQLYRAFSILNHLPYHHE